MNNAFMNDNFDLFSIVIESVTEPNDGFEIISDRSNEGLNFLRFRSVLQTYDRRNRNKRMWYSKYTKPMIMQDPIIKELISNGGVPGENGHPVPPSGEVSMERIVTIDPNNISHVIKEFYWPSDTKVCGVIETVDDGNGPGDRFRRNIMQGLPVSFSTRSIIPQRKNPDGTIDQVGPGRYVTSDRVYVPGHSEAYIDKSIPVKDVCKKNNFQKVMESYVGYVVEKSSKLNRIVDGMNPAMESATMDNNGILSVRTGQGIVSLYPENKYRREFADILSNL